MYAVLREIMICLILWMVCCTPRRRRRDVVKKIHRTGIVIASDNLLRKYEEEHEKFCEEEIKYGNHLKWDALDSKNHPDYCRKYLDHSVPTRTTADATGNKINRWLLYEIKNAHITRKIDILQCKIMFKKYSVFYYVTRAPELNCVYALKCTQYLKKLMVSIINKYCDFEESQSMRGSLKRKREEIIDTMHPQTGQPIAKDKYLLIYEMEHQELLKREREGKLIKWPYDLINCYLDSYCYKYMEVCVPGRKREGVSGSMKIDRLRYQKLYTNELIAVAIVTCMPCISSKRKYHITRALETNCVFALIQKGFGTKAHFVIVFKYCDFEVLNDQQMNSKSYEFPEENAVVMPKTEIKNEKLTTLKTMQFFPND